MTAPSADEHPLFLKWQEQIEDLLKSEVYLLNCHQELFTQVRDDAVGRYPDQDFQWLAHYAHIYPHRQAVALRRVCEDQREVRSLYSLIDSIGRNRKVLSRRRHGKLATEGNRPARIPFRLEPPGESHIHPEEITQSLAALEGTSGRIKEFVDTTIAHRDPGGGPLRARGAQSGTYAEIRRGIETVSDEAAKWSLCLTGTQVIPTPYVPATWKGILRHGLFSSSF